VLPATTVTVTGELTLVDGRITLPMSTTQFPRRSRSADPRRRR
jgi:hypothetical protein